TRPPPRERATAPHGAPQAGRKCESPRPKECDAAARSWPRPFVNVMDMGEKRVTIQKCLPQCKALLLAPLARLARHMALARDAPPVMAKHENAVADADCLHDVMGDEQRAKPPPGRRLYDQILHTALESDI